MADRGTRTRSSESGPATPATRDTSGRYVQAEEAYTFTETCQRETHRITPSGSVPRTGR